MYIFDKCAIFEIPESFHDKLKRSCIIPYFSADGENHYMLAIDKRTGKLTDMGGTVDEGEHFLDSALRELEEESMGVFTYQDLSTNSVCMYNEKEVKIFQEIIADFEVALDLCSHFREEFLERCRNKNIDDCLVENTHMLYISETNLRKLCKNENVPLPEEFQELCDFTTYPKLYRKDLIEKGFRGFSSLAEI
jgi:hypothetical protein